MLAAFAVIGIAGSTYAANPNPDPNKDTKHLHQDTKHFHFWTRAERHQRERDATKHRQLVAAKHRQVAQHRVDPLPPTPPPATTPPTETPDHH